MLWPYESQEVLSCPSKAWGIYCFMRWHLRVGCFRVVNSLLLWHCEGPVSFIFSTLPSRVLVFVFRLISSWWGRKMVTVLASHPDTKISRRRIGDNIFSEWGNCCQMLPAPSIPWACLCQDWAYQGSQCGARLLQIHAHTEGAPQQNLLGRKKERHGWMLCRQLTMLASCFMGHLENQMR